MIAAEPFHRGGGGAGARASQLALAVGCVALSLGPGGGFKQHLCVLPVSGDPDGEEGGVLGLPHGDATAHGAHLPGGGAGAGGRGFGHLPRSSEEERTRRSGKAEES